MELSKEDTKHVAHLSRLALTDSELIKFSDQLSDILGFMAKLSKVDTENVEPVAQITGLENVWRDDVIKSCEIKKEDLLKNAPDKKDDFIKVKTILE